MFLVHFGTVVILDKAPLKRSPAGTRKLHHTTMAASIVNTKIALIGMNQEDQATKH